MKGALKEQSCEPRGISSKNENLGREMVLETQLNDGNGLKVDLIYLLKLLLLLLYIKET